MVDQDRSSSPEERSLQALLRRAAGEGTREPLDESEVLEYLAGTADEATTRKLQARIAASATLRRELVGLSRSIEDLSRPDVQRAFDARPAASAPSPPAPAARPIPRRDSLLDRFFGLFRVPAYAAAFVFALMAYPTFRFLSDPPASRDAVLLTQSVPLRADRGATRGPGAGPPLAVSRGSGRLLELTLWAERRPGPEEKLRLTVEGTGGLIHSDQDFRGVTEHDGDPAYRLVLDGARIEDGVVTIRVEHLDAAGSAVSPAETYRIRLSD